MQPGRDVRRRPTHRRAVLRPPTPCARHRAHSDGAAALLAAHDVAAHLGAALRLVSVLEIDSTCLVGLDAGPRRVDYETERRGDRVPPVRRQCAAVLDVDPRGAGSRVEVRHGDRD